VQKRNRERKECEEKENKRKEVRGDQHIKVVEVKLIVKMTKHSSLQQKVSLYAK